jgi:hypothetical protein
MSTRTLFLAAATLVALSPVIASASPERAALSSCVRAFAASLGAPGSTAPSVKVKLRGDQTATSMMDFYTREYTFELSANDPKTGLSVGRVSCEADSHGAVIALSALPSRAPLPTVARN